MYVEFETKEEFEIWHEVENKAHGFPNDKGTLEYTYSIEHPENDSVIAFIDDNCINIPETLYHEQWAIDNGYIVVEEGL